MEYTDVELWGYSAQAEASGATLVDPSLADQGALAGTDNHDLFLLSRDAISRIVGFDDGDALYIDPDTSITGISQVGNDVVLSFAEGNQLVLEGVQLNSLGGDWLVF